MQNFRTQSYFSQGLTPNSLHLPFTQCTWLLEEQNNMMSEDLCCDVILLSYANGNSEKTSQDLMLLCGKTNGRAHIQVNQEFILSHLSSTQMCRVSVGICSFLCSLLKRDVSFCCSNLLAWCRATLANHRNFCSSPTQTGLLAWWQPLLLMCGHTQTCLDMISGVINLNNDCMVFIPLSRDREYDEHYVLTMPSGCVYRHYVTLYIK